MKKLNLKVWIAGFSVLLIALVATAMLSFTSAEKTINPDDATSTDAAGADGDEPTADTLTMIDKIINNSHDGDDKNYRIVEISAGTTSKFKDFCENHEETVEGKSVTVNDFIKYVFNGNKTIKRDFSDAATIDYHFFTAKNILSADLDIIRKADLIYLSNPENKFDKNNDIPSELVTILSTFAIGDYKPLIIDYPSNGGGEVVRVYNYSSLYLNVLKSTKRYSLKWPTDGTKVTYEATPYMSNSSPYLYLPIHGDAQKANWTDPNVGLGKIAKMAVISAAGNSSDAYISNSVLADLTPVTGDDLSNLVAEGADPLTDVYQLPTESALYKYGYRYDETRPAYVDFDYYASDAVIDYETLSKYDMIFIEDSLSPASATIDSVTYSAIASCEGAKKHIIYGSYLADNARNNASSSVITKDTTTAQNYKTVLDKTVSNTTSLYNNVLATSHLDFASLVSMDQKSGSLYTDNIVYIINNGNFRGMGGSGSTSDKYTLLEIEPCYPVDTTLAEAYKNNTISSNYTNSTRYNTVVVDNAFYYAGGYYYLNTLGVLNNKSSDEISFDDNASLSEIENDYVAAGYGSAQEAILAAVSANSKAIDYYAWKWSRAKFAKLINKPYDQVEVIHMSSTEFNATTATLLDNYDMIYIGGDYSSQAYILNWFSGLVSQNSGGEKMKEFFNAKSYSTNYTVEEFFAARPAYQMYSCYYDYFQMFEGRSLNSTLSLTERYNAEDTNTTVVNGNSGYLGAQLGNDISETKLKELEAYVAANMPVVVGYDVTKAFDTYNRKREIDLRKCLPASAFSGGFIDQNITLDVAMEGIAKMGIEGCIDPNSNMYVLLKELSSKSTSTGSNVLWGFDADSTYRISNDGTFGNTFGGFATVFMDDTKVTNYKNQDVTYTASSYKASNEDSGYMGQDVTSVNGAAVKSLYASSKVRPKFELTKCPPEYSTGMKVTSGQLDFTVTINDPKDTPVDVTLFIDDNGDSKFTSDEKVIGPTSMTNSGTLSYPYDKDFYGAIYWKVLVENGNVSSSITGVCEVQRTTQERRDINIIQIMTDQADDCSANSWNYQGPDTIYLDSENMQACNILDANRFDNMQGNKLLDTTSSDGVNGRLFGHFNDASLYADNINNLGLDNMPNVIINSVADDIDQTKKSEKYGFTFAKLSNGYSGNKLGIHESRFGFVGNSNSEDSTGMYHDDYYKNLADNVDDDINLHVVTMTVQDFNDYAANIMNAAEAYPEMSSKDWDKLASDYYDYFKYIENYIDGQKLKKGNDIRTKMETAYPDLADLEINNASINLDKCIDTIMGDSTYKSKITKGNAPDSLVNTCLQNIKDEHSYYDMYSYFYQNGLTVLNNEKLYNGKTYKEYYTNWRNVIYYQQYFYYKYLYYKSLAGVTPTGTVSTSGETTVDEGYTTDTEVAGSKTLKDYAGTGKKKVVDITNVYSLVVLGAAIDYCEHEDFSSHGLNALVNYTANKGVTIAFCDAFHDGNSGKKFSLYMKEFFGILNDSTRRTSTSGYLSTDIATKNKLFTKVATTIRYKKADDSEMYGPKGNILYRYARFDGNQWKNTQNQTDAQWDYAKMEKGFVNTNYASGSIGTTGLMKSYPNAISDYLKVSSAIVQCYSIDLDNPKVTVYYSLAGGTNETESSYFAADKNNGSSYYYLYTCDNCTFINAGRAKITGYNKKNIEEKQLIINAIINATKSKAIASNTTLELKTHDPDSVYKIVDVSPSSDVYTHYQYETEWSEDMEDPFKFIYNVKYDKDKGVTCTKLQIYFDLDYEENPVDADGNPVAPKHQFDAGKDQMVYNGDSKYSYTNESGTTITDRLLNDHNKLDVQVNCDIYEMMFRGARYDDALQNALKLRNDYFTSKYKNDYTYLVVTVTDCVKDETGKEVYTDITKVIKIKKKPYLFDLT